ncbi:MAG TPA: NACHT domain-containing protein [Anaerolineales bacterium]|nr:NACHT domain-containing protein [Anaerolineales bacterium]HNN12960.1 NACHT domain-containing protein [Anaerolineales bacterium]
MLNNLSDIISIVLGLAAIGSGLYQFFSWLRKKDPSLDNKTAAEFLTRQKNALEAWKLFNFQRDIKIRDVYVEEILNLPARTGPYGAGSNKGTEYHAHEIFKIVNESSDQRHYFFVGQAGSGKSTLLRFWTLELCAEWLNHKTGGSPLPVYISLSRLGAQGPNLTLNDLALGVHLSIPGVTEETAATIIRSMQSEKDRRRKKRNSRFFKKFPFKFFVREERPKWILFLDGLDEMAQEHRPKLFHWLKGLPGPVAVVLASRLNVLENLNTPAASREYQVCDFKEEQIVEFVGKWFKDHDQGTAEEFITDLHTNPPLRRIAAIPLLLTCLCMDMEIRGSSQFPSILLESDILKKSIEILIDKWDASREERPPDQKKITLGMNIYRDLAMAYPYGALIDQPSLEACIKKNVEKMGLGKLEEQVFLEKFTSTSRILLGSSEQGYSFGHTLFYDYFFSENIKEFFQPIPA